MKNNKSVFLARTICLMLTVVIALFVTILLAACSCGDNHDYSSDVTKEPTCYSLGEITYTCSKCGDSYTEDIPLSEHSIVFRYDDNQHWQACENCVYATDKSSHSYDKVVQSVPSSCHATGIEIKACVCGATANTDLPLTSHSFTVAQKDENGHWSKCADCDAVTDVEPHEFKTEVSREPSTCTEAGTVVYACACGQTHTEALNKAEHIYDKTVFDSYFHWSVCSNCGQDKPNQDKVAHDKSVSSTDNDCTHSGSAVTVCSGCDYTDTQTIPALGHSLDTTVFSKAADSSKHYYKCNRCDENIGEVHIFVDVVCADGLDCEATCYRTGHKDEQCKLCGFTTHLSTPITNEHDFSNKWDNNGTHHWHKCLNGDGECEARDSAAMHVWVERSIAALCDTDGSSWRECESCGYVQDGSRKTVSKLGHDYQTVEIIASATCTQEGRELQCCSRCDAQNTATIKKLPHDLSLYGYNEREHWNRCANCSFEQSYKSGHTLDGKLDVVLQEGSCEENRIVKHTCKYCHYEYTEVTKSKGHNYITEDPTYTDTSKFKDTTCTELGWHMEICTICNNSVKVYDKELLPHDLEYHNAKQPTQSAPGNIAYQLCTVCGQYYSKDALERLSEDEVFIYLPKVVLVNCFEDLYGYALNVGDGQESYDFYQLNAKIVEIKQNSKIVVGNVDGSGENYTFDIPENVDVWSLETGIVVTLKFNIEVIFVDGEPIFDLINTDILTIVGNDNRFNLFVESNLSREDGEIKIVYDGLEFAFSENIKYFDVLEKDKELVVNYTRWGNSVKLLKVFVDGEAITATNGTISLSVAGDTHIQLQFSSSNETSVTMDGIDTSLRDDMIVVDEYVKYEYVGNYNNEGHILQNSHLRFYLSNANIVEIVLTYDDFNLGGENNVCNNSLFVGIDNENPSLSKQRLDTDNQVRLGFDAELGYQYIDYFTDVCQARLIAITIRYATNNTFAD